MSLIFLYVSGSKMDSNKIRTIPFFAHSVDVVRANKPITIGNLNIKKRNFSLIKLKVETSKSLGETIYDTREFLKNNLLKLESFHVEEVKMLIIIDDNNNFSFSFDPEFLTLNQKICLNVEFEINRPKDVKKHRNILKTIRQLTETGALSLKVVSKNIQISQKGDSKNFIIVKSNKPVATKDKSVEKDG